MCLCVGGRGGLPLRVVRLVGPFDSSSARGLSKSEVCASWGNTEVGQQKASGELHREEEEEEEEVFPSIPSCMDHGCQWGVLRGKDIIVDGGNWTGHGNVLMDAGGLLFKGGILEGDSCVWLLVF